MSDVSALAPGSRTGTRAEKGGNVPEPATGGTVLRLHRGFSDDA